MRENREKSFAWPGATEPAADLFGKIMLRVNKERRNSALKRLAACSAGLVLCAAVFISALGMLKSGLVESGFVHFSALIFSDLSVALVYWRSFAFALLETLPAASAAVVLASIFAFLILLKFLIGGLEHLSALKQTEISAV